MDQPDPSKTDAELARAFVDKYYSLEKPCVFSLYGGAVQTEEYCKAFYEAARKKF